MPFFLFVLSPNSKQGMSPSVDLIIVSIDLVKVHLHHIDTTTG